MKRSILGASLLCLALVASACSSNEKPKPQDKPPLDIPEWFASPPNRPGKAFYGVGVGSFGIVQQMNAALNESANQARRQIADTMQVEISALMSSYAAQIVAPDGSVYEESLRKDVMEAFTNQSLQGAEIIRRYITPKADERGQRIVYSLAQIDFESVVETLHNAAAQSQAITKVKENAREAIDDLRSRVREAQEQKSPAREVPPPIEGETMPNQN